MPFYGSILNAKKRKMSYFQKSCSDVDLIEAFEFLANAQNELFMIWIGFKILTFKRMVLRNFNQQF